MIFLCQHAEPTLCRIAMQVVKLVFKNWPTAQFNAERITLPPVPLIAEKLMPCLLQPLKIVLKILGCFAVNQGSFIGQ